MAESAQLIVYCGECSAKLDEDPDAELGSRPPCVECGSYARSIRTSEPNGGLMMKMSARKPGQRRAYLEQWLGDSFSKDVGRWRRLQRIIDRRGNRYYERIHDPATRDVIREVNEPLAEHRDRGSAKFKRR